MVVASDRMLTGLTLFAIVMSLGPHIHAKGRHHRSESLRVLLQLRPGFDGVRAPARYGMIQRSVWPHSPDSACVRSSGAPRIELPPRCWRS
jgi:hypothetical protein